MVTTRAGLASFAALALLTSCSVASLFDAPPSKVIAVTPPRVVETAPVGDTMRTFPLAIFSASNAAPQWTAQHNPHAAWLTLAATGGTAPDTLRLTLDPKDITPDIYRDTVVIDPCDPGIATVRVPVELHILASAPPPPPPPPPNQPPVASFTFSCNGLGCDFTSTSSDPDGTVVSYSWTFGDGGTSPDRNPSHTYSTDGSYTVRLTVTDNEGAQSTPASQTVTVSAPPPPPPPPPNQPPVASFTFSCNGLGCDFTSTSSDPDGTVASYSWTFGDGGTSPARNPSHTYSTDGSYTVRLTVTDNQGAQSTPASQTVTVSAPPPPPPPPPNQPPVASFTFSCNGRGCDFTSTSSDPDGTVASYSWTFGDGGTSPARNPSHTYSADGSYTVRLTVTDNQGAQSTPASQTVTVSAPPPPPPPPPPNQPPVASFT